MKVLVIGGGGREDALVWRLKACESVEYVAQAKTKTDYVNLADHLGIDLVVVGPEAPLVEGVVDRFRRKGVPVVGPTAGNAALEGSKAHSKRFMQQLGIPTARFTVANDAAEALKAAASFNFPVVVKSDGLAAGKGVVIAQNDAELRAAVYQLARPLVIEEFLEGEEVSFIALCDGKRAVALEPSQDHKRIFDNDQGPNTGGMGAYSDSRILSGEQRRHIMNTIVNPVVAEAEYTGFLYAGLMMTANGPSVLEFNVRLGDPETQPLMMRLESDWGHVLMAAALGELPEGELEWSAEPATCVVMASEGYPGEIKTGRKITGIEEVGDGAVVFQAGTELVNGDLLTAGGRVLGVTARGADLKDSIDRAYAAVSKIRFEGMQYRKDIGAKGLRRYNEVGSGT